MMGMILCKQVNQLDMVDYLEKLGHAPKKVRNGDYWYLSPLRTERTASFKVNRKLNLWYDHGMGRGGGLIDFCLLYFQLPLEEVLRNLRNDFQINNARVTPLNRANQANCKPRIIIIDIREIMSHNLQHYFKKRGISLGIARQYCREVEFQLYGKAHVAIGFQNIAGGYELRNTYFKGCCSPKDVSFIDHSSTVLSVFEGFFNFLSWQALGIDKPDGSNFLILNSLSFFEKSRKLMEEYSTIPLFLDRDAAGFRCTEEALKWSEKFVDKSLQYHPYNDLNEWLVNGKTRNQDKIIAEI